MPLPPINDIATLRDIIHSLRIDEHNLSDQAAQTRLRALIKGLPSPEALESIAGDRASIKIVADQVGKIMEAIEEYRRRDADFATRHIAVKGIPPRHETLKRRHAMSLEKNRIVRQLTNFSSIVDDRKQPKLAAKLLRCASALHEDKATMEDVVPVLQELEANGHADLLKEAGMLGGLKELWQDTAQAVGDRYKSGSLKQTFKNVVNSIDAALVQAQNYANSVKNPQKLKSIQNTLQMLANMKKMSTQVYTISESIDAPETTIPQPQPAPAQQNNQVDDSNLTDEQIDQKIQRLNEIKSKRSQAAPNQPAPEAQGTTPTAANG